MATCQLFSAAREGHTCVSTLKLGILTGYSLCLQDLSQQDAALLLIAAVLYKAIDGLQAQQLSSNSRSVTETKTDTAVDWQAVWTYAVGPGLELASSLR